MSKITNTTALGPMMHLLDAFALGASEAIQHSERQGAAQMAAQTEQLPARGLDDPAFAAMGVVAGDVIASDPLFRRVTLPDGWKIERTDHHMWTKLVDADGIERAEVFYKAAFYDRDAFIRARKP